MVLLGVGLGFYGSRRNLMVCVQALCTTLLLLFAILAFFGDHPQERSLRYATTLLAYWMLPYLIFFLTPSLIGIAIVRYFRRTSS